MKEESKTIRECDNCHIIAPVYIDCDAELVCAGCVIDENYGI